MKRKIISPDSHPADLQAIIDYLVDNGVSDFQANMLLHTNFPSLGDTSNLIDAAREGRWEDAWNTVELYIAGDLW